MHKTAMEHADLFFKTYMSNKAGLKVVELGSQDVNGSIRSKCPPGNSYVGIDFVEGKGVDTILTDPYSLPFDENSFDICVTSSCFEHSEFFWVVFLEIVRIVKPNGLIYINVPSNGMVHQWPVDCWRFYPDSGVALQNWARRNGYRVEMLESFVGAQRKSLWNDFVAVFVKDAAHADEWPDRIVDRNINLEGHDFTFTNAHVRNRAQVINPAETPEDQLFRPVKGLRRWLSARRGGFTFRE